MIRRLWPILLAVAASLACGLDTIDVPVSGGATIRGSPLSGTPLAGLIDLSGLGDVRITDSREFKNQGVSEGDVDSVHVKSLTLRAAAPPEATLDFIDNIAFYAEAPGAERVRIARGTIPAGARTVDLRVDDVDLKAHAVAESMKLTVEAEGSAPPQDVNVAIDVVFEVNVSVGPF